MVAARRKREEEGSKEKIKKKGTEMELKREEDCSVGGHESSEFGKFQPKESLFLEYYNSATALNHSRAGAGTADSVQAQHSRRSHAAHARGRCRRSELALVSERLDAITERRVRVKES